VRRRRWLPPCPWEQGNRIWSNVLLQLD
jgi:hypothetical protein